MISNNIYKGWTRNKNRSRKVQAMALGYYTYSFNIDYFCQLYVEQFKRVTELVIYHILYLKSQHISRTLWCSYLSFLFVIHLTEARLLFFLFWSLFLWTCSSLSVHTGIFSLKTTSGYNLPLHTLYICDTILRSASLWNLRVWFYEKIYLSVCADQTSLWFWSFSFEARKLHLWIFYVFFSPSLQKVNYLWNHRRAIQYI